MTIWHPRLATARHAFSMCCPYQRITSASSMMGLFLFGVLPTLWAGTGCNRGQVSSLFFWMKGQLTNTPTVPELRRMEVEVVWREVVDWSCTVMLREWVDLDRTYMEGDGTVGWCRRFGVSFCSGASLFSGVLLLWVDPNSI